MTQILNRSEQQEKDQRKIFETLPPNFSEGEDINVSFRSDGRIPNSYKLDKGKIRFGSAVNFFL